MNKMTVPALKSLAKEMNVPTNSKMRKDDLIAVIKVQIELDHVKALEDEAFRNESVEAKPLDARELVLKKHFDGLKRYNPSGKKDKNGKVILTPAQRRRLHKKVNSYAKKIGFFSYGV